MVVRGALGMVTYDSRVSEGAAMLNRDARAWRQVPPRAPLRPSHGFLERNCADRRLDSTAKKAGDWASTGGEETDRTLLEREVLI